MAMIKLKRGLKSNISNVTLEEGEPAIAFTDANKTAAELYVGNGNGKVQINLKGATGPAGPQGAAGAKGDAGTAATITIGTVTTGDAGTSATVTNAGTTTAAKLNFTIPRGATGAQGPQGAAGAKGADGKNGTNGTSAAWFTGTDVTGTSTSAATFTVSGSKAGDMYLNKSTWNVYRASAANSWVYVCNIKGAQGAQGATGSQGPAGPTGPQGPAGSNANITGGASTVATANLTANCALVSNSSGKIAVSAVTATELGYLDGVTSAIQTQLNGKAASGHTHSNYLTSSSTIDGGTF